MTENRLNIVKMGRRAEYTFCYKVYTLLWKMPKHTFSEENLFSSCLACKSAKVKS